MKKLKQQHIIQFIIILAIIALVNFISYYAFFRIDLTSEKRYTLKPITKKTLKNLEDVVYIEVYLDGNLPSGLERLSQAIKEHLDEYRVYAKDNIEYQFINPYEEDKEERNALFKDLSKRGIKPITIQHSEEEGEVSQKTILPGAILRYRNREFAVNLFKNRINTSSEQNLNHSIESLEYEFIVAINNLVKEKIKKVAFIEGHGELDPLEVYSISKEISKFYQVDRGRIDKPSTLHDYLALFIAKPERKFSEKEKFAVDQYIMNGGKVLWFLDAVRVSLDSLAKGSAFAVPLDVNLQDMLFNYGVRINSELIKDLNCSLIPINMASRSEQPNFHPLPWEYYPLLEPSPQYTITNKIDPVKAQFIQPIDTLKGDSLIKKKILLSSSRYSKKVRTPSFIRLAEATKQVDQQAYNSSFIPTGILLEGTFESVFKNRMVKHFMKNDTITFKQYSKHTQMFIASDGDIIRNEVQMTRQGPKPLPLGYDRYTRQKFGNKNFIMNMLLYLTDDAGLTKLRAKDFSLRLLNKTKVKNEKIKWNLINILSPVFLFIIAGIIITLARKHIYSGSLNS